MFKKWIKINFQKIYLIVESIKKAREEDQEDSWCWYKGRYEWPGPLKRIYDQVGG